MVLTHVPVQSWKTRKPKYAKIQQCVCVGAERWALPSGLRGRHLDDLTARGGGLEGNPSANGRAHQHVLPALERRVVDHRHRILVPAPPSIQASCQLSTSASPVQWRMRENATTARHFLRALTCRQEARCAYGSNACRLRKTQLSHGDISWLDSRIGIGSWCEEALSGRIGEEEARCHSPSVIGSCCRNCRAASP